MSWLGLLLLALALALINSSDAFPGAWALLPTLGAAFLIQAGPQTRVNQALAWRPIVWIGLISYPLYLWHWPLLTYARIIEGETPAAGVRGMLLGLSVILAWVTYRYVERPVRSRIGSRALVWALCVAMVVVGVSGFVVKSAHGYRHRLAGMMNGDPTTMVIGADRGRLQPGCGIPEGREKGLNYCFRSADLPARYVVVGDSKAEALFYGLVRESAPGTAWSLIGTVYPPLPGGAPTDRQQEANRLAFKSLLSQDSVQVVILATALRTIHRIDAQTGFIRADAVLPEAQLEAYGQAIESLLAAGKRVVFVIDNPTFPDPTSCVRGGATGSPWMNQWLYRKENPHCQLRLSDHLAGTRPYREFVAELQRRHPRLEIYDPTPLLCDTQRDLCPMTQGDRFLYSYGDHLSDHASSLLARDFLSRLDRLP